MIKAANRLQNISEYYFSRKLREIEEINRTGKPVINLGIGNPDLNPHFSAIQTLNRVSNKIGTHGYQSYKGIPALRDGFAMLYKNYFNVELNPESEILPLLGSKEGIMHISMAFLNPGDSVLIPNPGYPAYASSAQLIGANVIYYNLKEENNFLPDFNELNSLDLCKTKLMWVNYPNMPTGTPANTELFKKLVDFGIRHNILICNDNPYSFILNNNQLSILSVPNAKNIAMELNSLSKSHNMAGWRIGMLAGNKEYIQYVLTVKSNMDSGMFLPLQLAASEALKLGKDWFDSVNEVYSKRRVIAQQIFDFIKCEYDINQVGMFLWAKISHTQKGAETISDEILYKHRVFITPGSIFGSNGQNFLRLSLCTSQEKLNEAFQRLKS